MYLLVQQVMNQQLVNHIHDSRTHPGWCVLHEEKPEPCRRLSRKRGTPPAAEFFGAFEGLIAKFTNDQSGLNHHLFHREFREFPVRYHQQPKVHPWEATIGYILDIPLRGIIFLNIGDHLNSTAVSLLGCADGTGMSGCRGQETGLPWYNRG